MSARRINAQGFCIGSRVTRKAFFLPNLLPPLILAAQEAGTVIMGFYRAGTEVTRKEDASPVTEADRAADRHIVAALHALTPDWPVVSEEGDKPDVTGADYFWLVDPLDGTKSFVRGEGYFTVNIGLIHLGHPVLGVIYDPAGGTLYAGSEEGAFRMQAGGVAQPIRARGVTPPRTALISHSHINRATEDYLTAQGITERIPCASSIKFCWLAEGRADIYPRFGATMEWDTAAGHAILLSAGGRMTTAEGMPFVYGKSGFLNGNFIAVG